MAAMGACSGACRNVFRDCGHCSSGNRSLTSSPSSPSLIRATPSGVMPNADITPWRTPEKRVFPGSPESLRRVCARLTACFPSVERCAFTPLRSYVGKNTAAGEISLCAIRVCTANELVSLTDASLPPGVLTAGMTGKWISV